MSATLKYKREINYIQSMFWKANTVRSHIKQQRSRQAAFNGVVRTKIFLREQGPVVQSVVSLTSTLRVISLTVLADSIHNILIFFAEKM